MIRQNYRGIIVKLIDWYIRKQHPGKYVKHEDLKIYLAEAVAREAARIHSMRDVQEKRLETRMRKEQRAELDLMELDIRRLNDMLAESEQWKDDLESLRLTVMKRAKFNEKISSDVARSLERFKISLASIVGQVQGVSQKAFDHNQINYSEKIDSKEREVLGQRTHDEYEGE